MVGQRTVWKMDTLLVYRINMHTTRTMDDLRRTEKKSYVGDIGCLRITISVVEESQIARLSIGQAWDEFTLSHLFTGIAQKIDTHCRIDYLCKARAVHTHEVLASPEIGGVQ